MRFITFDGMVFPFCDDDTQWRLRHGEPTRRDLLRAATVMGAYQSLVVGTPTTTSAVSKLRKVRAGIRDLEAREERGA